MARLCSVSERVFEATSLVNLKDKARSFRLRAQCVIVILTLSSACYSLESPRLNFILNLGFYRQLATHCTYRFYCIPYIALICRCIFVVVGVFLCVFLCFFVFFWSVSSVLRLKYWVNIEGVPFIYLNFSYFS
jgi:hypothetical protein